MLSFKSRLWNYYRNEGLIIKKKRKPSACRLVRLKSVVSKIKNMHLRILPPDGRVKSPLLPNEPGDHP